MSSLRLIALAAVLCGAALLVQANRNARIIQGVQTPIEKAPFLVQLLYRNEDDHTKLKLQTCGGVIIDDRRVLTAAHCLDKLHKHLTEPKKYLGVIAGGSAKNWGRIPGKLYPVQSVTLFPKYKRTKGHLQKETEYNPKFDLAILKTETPIKFSYWVKPIEITKTKVPGNTRVSVGGWGINTTAPSDDFMQNFHTNLHVAQQDIMPHDECTKYLQGVRLPEDAKTSLLCTRNVNGGACNGDSGSGLWIEPKSASEPAVLVGLVQGGVACDLHHPGLYVDLADPEIQEFLVKHKA